MGRFIEDRRNLKRACAATAAWLLLGCGGAKPAGECPEREPVRILFDTHTEVNHDRDGFARSVVVRAYQLEDPAAFEQVDFDALWQGAAIEGALGGPDEVTLIPGRSQAQEIKRRPKALLLGLAANFREQTDDGAWKTIVKLPPPQDPCGDDELVPFELKVALDRYSLSVP